MFFKEYYKAISDCIDAKFRGIHYENLNPSDKGELCELFIKEFLTDSLGDAYKIYRGGKIIDYENNHSKQLDIVLCGKKTIKIFGDKGLYPTESVFGVFSISATLTKRKLIDSIEEFKSIPKINYDLSLPGFLPQSYVHQCSDAWRYLIPYKCLFTFQGEIKEDFVEILKEYSMTHSIPPYCLPDLIVVNKRGVIQKRIERNAANELEFDFDFIDFESYSNYGYVFSWMVFNLYTMAYEENIIQPKYERYFNKDLEL